MGNFRDRRGGGGGRNFGPRRDFDRPRPEMHKAICASCGKECSVPFRPTGDRPVYCSDCFEKQNGGQGGERRSFGRDDRGSRSNFRRDDRPAQPNYNEQFQSLNAKLDKILRLLEAGSKNNELGKTLEENKPEIAPEVAKEAPKKKRVAKKKVESETPMEPIEAPVEAPTTPEVTA